MGAGGVVVDGALLPLKLFRRYARTLPLPLLPVPPPPMMSTPFSIRPATKSDTQDILRLIRGLAIYEKAEKEAKATPQLIHKNLFPDDGQRPYAECLIVERTGPQDDESSRAIALAIYFYNFSSVTDSSSTYLSAHNLVESKNSSLFASPPPGSETNRTWTGQPGLYLEDLFVMPEHRNLGVGKALFRE